jgi:hypothetical protein
MNEENCNVQCDILTTIVRAIRKKYPTQLIEIFDDMSFGLVICVRNPDFDGDIEQKDPYITKLYLTDNVFECFNLELTF